MSAYNIDGEIWESEPSLGYDQMVDALDSWSELAKYYPILQDVSPTSMPPRPAELGPELASSIASYQSVPIPDMRHLARSS